MTGVLDSRLPRLLFGLSLLVCVTNVCECSRQSLEDFRKKYTADYIIRDTEHIKEDLKYLVDLQGSGSMSESEASFYIMRMHDFDDNNLLDGLEIMQMVSHSAHLHGDTEGLTTDIIAASVDAFMAYDENHDGYVSYVEWASSLNRSKIKNPM